MTTPPERRNRTVRRTRPSGPPVLVVGAGLAGMAAAGRLAKAGHPVELLERRDRTGGLWAPSLVDGVPVDEAPAVIGFPAPWRDLFKKSGRAMDAELTRAGLDLAPAAPALHRFSDGTELLLPTDRGDQYAAVAETYGRATAESWRSFIDRLDDVWQALRPLGMESELRHRRQLNRKTRSVLRSRHSVESLARRIGHPHLGHLIRAVAHRLGSTPRATPAFCAVRLSVERRFGRWTVVAAEEHGRTSALIEQIEARLRLRKVNLRVESSVEEIVLSAEGRAVGVRTEDGSTLEAPGVICTADPWQTYQALLPFDKLPFDKLPFDKLRERERAAVTRLSPALHPRVTFSVSDEPCTEVTEIVDYDPSGIPTITYRRPALGRTVSTVHDYREAVPRVGAGVAWDGFRSWLHRPPITSSIPGLFLAGPQSRGGAGLSETLLSGALASYACHDALDAEDPAFSE